MAALDAVYEDLRTWTTNKAWKRAGGDAQMLQEILVEYKIGMDSCREGQQFIVGRLYERENIKELVAEEVCNILATSKDAPSLVARGRSSYAAIASRVPAINMNAKKKVAPPKKEKVVLIYPDNNEQGQPKMTSEETKKK